MSCYKGERYGWCKNLPVVYTDDEGKEYCVFHAPQGKKGISVEEFNKRIFEKINEAKKTNDKCILDYTVFEGDISFSQFDKDNPLPKISFMIATFSEDTTFSEVTFCEDTTFFKATFSGKVFFEKAIFSKKANFRYTTFHEDTHFDGATFSGEADFHKTTFSKEANFWGTTFSERAIFFSTTFDKDIDFFKARFNKEADFLGTTFSKRAYFSLVTFSKEADFRHTKFSETAMFTQTIFGEKANFIMTLFSERADFTELTIAEKIRFEGVNLSTVSFIDTDLTRIDFISCDWAKSHGRNVLYDEIYLFRNNEENIQENKKTGSILNRFKQRFKKWWHPDKERIKKVEILYRQLKRKCKEDHNELDISDWHYGEKEMFRKEKRLRRRFFPISLSNLYWLSSGYGERPARAGIGLILLILVISVLFGFAGLIPNSELKQELTLEPINEIKDLVKNPLEVLVNTLQYATFEKDTYFMPQNIWGTFLKIFAKLFIPLQAALFAFSVRNRFKR